MTRAREEKTFGGMRDLAKKEPMRSKNRLLFFRNPPLNILSLREGCGDSPSRATIAPAPEVRH
jgi:hypothetical protein